MACIMLAEHAIIQGQIVRENASKVTISVFGRLYTGIRIT